ncbi:hypothetical protein NCCP2495_30010 [Dietzia sp. NCCP-2495]|uniref:hypothetical protein n=1 Tax=Dietzia sp. NCCP-2495 TaxID=2934675 RepID=UPI002230E768|nr:hypothetical protein [Dietzia sp. NCCP-2495]GLB65121.1 hypothetical protein NCCP2495_30010 [Dietzia sp. NCCP-2495]
MLSLNLKTVIRWIRGTSLPLRDLSVSETVDARGFPQAHMTDAKRHQLAVANLVDGSGVVEPDRISAWTRQVAGLDRLRVSFACDSTTSAPPLLGGLFSAQTKAERKDLTELASIVAVDAPALYDAAALAGLPARPARESDVAGRCGHLLAAAVRTIPDLTELTWHESARSVQVGSVECISFTVSCSDPASGAEASADLSEVLAEWDAGGHIWRTRWMRPFVDPDSVSAIEAADGGRVWSTVTVAGGHEIAHLFLQALRPRTRLRVRHESGRQGVMLAANLGLGVAGFQHATIDTELPR